MFCFNGVTYDVNNYNEALNRHFHVDIKTPYDIETYIEKIKDGEEVEGTIEVVHNGNTKEEVSKENLLKLLYANIGICPTFLDMEEYKDKPLTELQILSNQLIWDATAMPNTITQVDEEDIRNFFKMSKYSQDMLRKSNFNEYAQIAIMKAFSILYREKKILPEYSVELDKCLHNLYGNLPRFDVDVLPQIIDLYHHAPFLVDYLIDLPRFSYIGVIDILNDLSKNEIIRDELNSWAMEKIDPAQIDLAIKFISRIMESSLENSLYNFSECYNMLLYMDNELLDSEENIFIAPQLQDILKDITPTSYTYWHCPEFGISGTLDETNEDKLKKFVDAINREIDELLLKKDPLSELFDKVSITDVDIVLLDRLKELDGNDYKIEKTFEKAISQLLAKSKFLRYSQKDPHHTFSIIEEDGEKYNTSYGEIYKCENALLHQIRGGHYISQDTITYKIDVDYSSRRTAYYRTTPEVVKDMGLLSLCKAKETSLDAEMFKYIKEMPYYGRTTAQKVKAIEEKIMKKMMGIEPIVKPRNPYADLQDAFKAKFGRAPRIMPQIVTAINMYFNEKKQEFINNFNYKNIARIMGEKTPTMIRLSLVFNWSETPKGLQEMLKCYTTSKNIETIVKNKNLILECYKNIKEKDLIALFNFIDRVDSKKLETINEKIEKMYSTKDNAIRNVLKDEIENDIRNLIYESKQELGKLDAIQAEEEYDYNIINNSSELLGDNICVMSGPYRAYFLNSMDYEHFSVGYDTSCCQHYGGAGEQCVIAASSSPHCGTLVIKTHEGVTKAQAFVWEGLDKNNNKVLVLDNIEFANDREVKDYLEILYAFCKESPYDTIHMGLGFNEKMSNIGERICDEIVCRPIIPFMDHTFNYSDYGNATYLKKNGEMKFEVETTYYTQKFETPSIIETKSHGINLTGNTLVAQHYSPYYDNCAKTTQLINKDGELVLPKQYPIYPFEANYINVENHIMKWDEVKPTDFAITITRTREDTIVIKPIALDGNEIPQLNDNQAKTIMKEIEELKHQHPEVQVVLKLSSYEEPIRIQSIDDINLITQSNYISSTPQGDTLYSEELTILPRFDDADARDYIYDDWGDGEEEFDEEEWG